MSEVTFIDKSRTSGTEDVVDKHHGSGPPPIFRKPRFGGDGDDSNGEAGKPLGNSFIAMILFIGADIMFFAGLIGAFIIFRYGAQDWPPPGQPLLPLTVTGVNTAILLLSGLTMLKTWRTLSNWNRTRVARWLLLTTIGGGIFLLIQGIEWVRLLSFGLKLSSGVYGATFYTLIGCHALHVFGAVIWLGIVTFRLNWYHAYGPENTTGIKLVGMYWFLVVALWPVLFGLVYWV